MKQYPIALCFLALFVAACTEEQNTDAAASADFKITSKEAAAFQKDGVKAYKLELPSLEKMGTPVPVKLPNLDPRDRGYNIVFEAPEGLTNIALNKSVTSSDDFPLTGDVVMITDGNKNAVDYVELSGGLQWVQIDLEKTSEIFSIAVWHMQGFKAYKDVVIMLSDDPEFKKDVQIVFNNDNDNSAGFGIGKDQTWEENNEGRLVILTKPLNARYVRLHVNGNTQNETNAYTEVEVYGR